MVKGIIAYEGIAIGKAVIHREQELILPLSPRASPFGLCRPIRLNTFLRANVPCKITNSILR